MIITGIDVGICNLGLFSVALDTENNIDDVIIAIRIDLTMLPHKKVERKDCKLYHTNDAADRIGHFIQEYSTSLDQSDVIVIERQPLGGLVHIEQLLYQHFRKKAILCNPRTLHKFFNLPQGNRDLRKEKSIELAQKYFPEIFCYFEKNERIHDIADACLMVMWYIKKTKGW